MHEIVLVEIDGKPVAVQAGSTVASALLAAGIPARRSISGEARAPLCGMGVCYECRVEINGIPQKRGCMVLCHASMKVRTQ